MNGRWAVQMDVGDALSAASLRTIPGLRVCSHPPDLWLTGDICNDDLDQRLKLLPARGRFVIDSTDRLVPLNGRVPIGRLPVGPWKAIDAWFQPQPQTAGLAGLVGSRMAIRVQRTDLIVDAGLLLTTMNTWHAFALTAAQVRLNPLRFALCADGRVAVHGQPLPPISGDRYVEEAGIAVPCGFAVDPPMGAIVLGQLLGLTAGDVALLGPDGIYETIPVNAFVVATRSAVRLSSREFEHG